MSYIINKLKGILKKEDPTILEIGCFEGKDSKYFLKSFKNIELYCFEADERNFKLFKRYVGEDNRCKIFHLAISSTDGEITFYQSFGPRDQVLEGVGIVERQASGSTRKPKDHLKAHPWCKFNNGVKVPCMKLDTWSKNNNINFIDLIWADVNGAEKDLIEGAKSILEKTKFFYTEFGPEGAEIYNGSITKKQIKNMLPNFEEMFEYKNNVLLRNKAFNE